MHILKYITRDVESSLTDQMHMRRISQNSYRQTALAILSLLTILLVLISGLRNTVWRDNIVLWSDVVRKAPNNERAHLSLGSAYSVAGMAEKAIAHLTTALQLRPNTASTYNNLGLEYAKAGLFDKAITMYNDTLRLNPASYKAYINRGNAFDAKGLPDKAIEDYNKAISIKPDYAGAYYERGLVFEQIGETLQAVADFQRACRMGTNTACEELSRLGKEIER